MTVAPEDIRNVALVGHKGVGKTSLVEAILYVTKTTPKLGKAGDRASGLDDTPEEKSHATTLEARLCTVSWGGKKIHLVDTPGEGGFQADARLALAAADAALVCVSAKDGVQTGTERTIKWVRDAQIPCLVVLTRVDDEHARIAEVLAELRSQLKLPVPVVHVASGAGPALAGVASVRSRKAYVGKPDAPGAAGSQLPADLVAAADDARARFVDDVAGTDDALTDRYLTDGDLGAEDLDRGARVAVAACKIAPACLVAPTIPAGVCALLDEIVDLVPAPSARGPWKGADAAGQPAERAPAAEAPVAAAVFKTRIDPHAGRISYARVLSGVLRPDATLLCPTTGQKERAAALLQGTAKESKPVTEAVAGELVAITKLKTVKTGETLCDEKHAFSFALPAPPLPLFSRTLVLEGKGLEDKAAQALGRLAEEDPGLTWTLDAQSRSLLLSGMGAAHLEVTLERVRRRASLDCKLGPPRVPYRETVRTKVANVEGKQKKQTGGHGQFGVCYIDLEPLPRGSGFVFEDAIVGGVIPRQFIPSVEKGVRKALDQGIVAGYPVTDLKVRLFDGKTHAVDSSDAAFQVAGYRAFRNAAAQATPAILEPIVKLEVTVPSENMGDVIGDLNSRGGKVMGTDSSGTSTTIVAFVSLAQTLDYEPRLTSLTSGRGTFTLAFDHYDYAPAIVQEKIVKESGFKLAADED